MDMVIDATLQHMGLSELVVNISVWQCIMSLYSPRLTRSCSINVDKVSLQKTTRSSAIIFVFA